MFTIDEYTHRTNSSNGEIFIIKDSTGRWKLLQSKKNSKYFLAVSIYTEVSIFEEVNAANISGLKMADNLTSNCLNPNYNGIESAVQLTQVNYCYNYQPGYLTTRYPNFKEIVTV